MTTLRELLNSAEDETDDSLAVVNKDLYWNVESRPTEHVLRFTDAATDDKIAYVKKLLEEMEHDVEFETATKFRITVSE